MGREQKPIQIDKPDKGDHVSAELLKEKFGLELGPGFKATSFSKEAAAKLAQTTFISPDVQKKKDFKHYNNSYIYVSFR